MVAALSGRGRQTMAMEEARALVFCATARLIISVLNGNVPVMAKPALIIACNIVSQPEEAIC
jgi:hypothetical protein